MNSLWNASGDRIWASRGTRVVLALRVLWNLGFCVLLLNGWGPGFTEVLEQFSRFVFIDGMLALAMALEYLRIAPRRLLWVSPAADSATRVVLAFLLRHGPGIAAFPVLLVMYIAILALFVFLDGALDLAEGISLRRELGARGGWVLLVTSGSIAMLIGGALFIADPDAQTLRGVLIVLSATHAVALGLAMRHIGTSVEKSVEP